MLQTAIEAARIGGKILMENYGKIDPATVERKRASDFVTQIDQQSEKAIISHILSRFPDHGILGEESGKAEAKSPYRWIIDPLDGTTNYIHAYPAFAISIAVEVEGEIQLGVIYDPLREDLFTAERGKGAYYNNKPIHVSHRSHFSDALLATGFPFRAKELLDVYLESFAIFFQQVKGIRRGGSAALDLAYLACGRFDGFWELKLGTWDIAAGCLLVEEAGGKVGDLLGGQNHLKTGDIVAANPYLFDEMVEITRKVFTGRIEHVQVYG